MPSNTGSRFSELIALMETLLSPEGCPWDREQDLQSLRPYLIEECFELVDAIDSGDTDNHREELGDLLFQIVFQSALQSRDKNFDIDDVAGGIVDKLRRRHPHVFGNASAANSAEVLSRWEQIKLSEKKAQGADTRHVLSGVPNALPALSRAQKISSKVARVGFEWETAHDCLAKVREETAEVEEAMGQEDMDQISEELGDLLFATTCLARKLGLDAPTCLAAANRKFEGRFARLEDVLASRDKTPGDSDLAEMDEIWNEIKQ